MLKKFGRNLIKILTLRCEESCRIQSHYLDHGTLGWVDWLAYAGHSISCRTCRQIHRQFKALEQAILALRKPVARTMSKAARRRIAVAIERFADQQEKP